MRTIQKGNMTSGNPLKIILLFSIPILIGNLFQQLYNVVDTAVIGHILGDDALASIGATTALYILVIDFCCGLTNGFSIVISQLFGAGEKERLRRAVSLSFVLTFGLAVIVTVAGVFGIDPLLRLLNTPEDVFSGASEYLHVILAFFVVTLFYNLLAALLRAVGNSTVPLLALICSTVVNILLDLWFVGGLGMGIAGAAYAPVIAQAVSVVFCLAYIGKTSELLRFRFSNVVFDRNLVGRLMGTGLSMSLMHGVVSIGSVTLQSAVNSFGAQVIAAHTTARKLDSLFMLPQSAVSTAAATFVGQNYGARRMDRVRKGLFHSLCLCLGWDILACIAAYAFGGPLVALLTGTSNAQILQTAVLYIRINTPFFFPLGVFIVLRTCLQSMNTKVVPILGSVMELVTKIVGVALIAPAFGYLGVCFLEPVIWVIGAIMVALDYVRVSRKQTTQFDRKKELLP